MALRRISRTIPPTGVVEVQTGNLFLLISTASAVNVLVYTGGSPEEFNGMLAGLKIQRVKPWDNLQLVGTAGASIEFWFGSENVEFDDVNIFTQIATLSGTSSVAIAASSVFTSQAKTTVAASTNVDIAANLSRKRISITNWSDSFGSFSVRDQAAAVDAGNELQPGQTMQFDTTAALRLRSDATAGNHNYSWNEES